MKPHPVDAMTRLAAADPARDLPLDYSQREQLWLRIAATPPGKPHRPARARAQRTRLRQLVLVIPALLIVTAGALAAGGVIRIGSPAEPANRRLAPLRGGGLVKGTVRLLPIATPNPGGGPPWGMRVLSTKTGEGCVQVGRLLDGKLGAIGQDSAFGDDGQFHEFALDSTFAKHACTLLDGNGRIFLNATVGDMPASAWVGFGGGCVPSTATEAERMRANGKPYPLCPQADERNLYYGLLGPDAESVTYKLGSHAYTTATVGPEGAYLIVTRASPTQLFNFNAGGTQDIVPVDGPITELHYRDGSTCHLTSRSWIGGKDACTPELKVPVGWVPPKTPAPTAAQVAAPLHTRLVRNHHGGYEIVVSFRSRVAITNARSTYTTRWREPHMYPGAYGGGPLSPPFPAAGQLVTAHIGELGSKLTPGTTSGEVIFQDSTGPGNLEEGPGTVEHVVGRFSVRVP
jgi:hypothetical protein